MQKLNREAIDWAETQLLLRSVASYCLSLVVRVELILTGVARSCTQVLVALVAWVKSSWKVVPAYCVVGVADWIVVIVVWLDVEEVGTVAIITEVLCCSEGSIVCCVCVI